MSDTAVDKGECASSGTLCLILLVAWLGWMFDGMEMGLYSLIAHPALKELLDPVLKGLSLDAQNGIIGPYVGLMFALFLFGASAGGFIFGRLGDKIGRVRTMIFTVIVYSVFTALSALAKDPLQFGACRFLGAMGLGGEWGLGVALVMETWPNASRPVLAGLLGSSANVGFLIASLIGKTSIASNWRLVLLAGLVPAFLALIIRLAVKEPAKWVKARERGERPDLKQLFEPELRRKTIMACLIASVAIVGTWGVFQWIPTWVNTLVGGNAASERSTAAMFMSFGQIIGAFLGGPMAEWLGRRRSYALFCVLSLVSTIALYTLVDSFGTKLLVLAALAGIPTTAFFGWLPLYLPELFPTRIRATGEGISFNFGRILAALGVLLGTGQLVAYYGGSFAKAGTTVALVYVIGLVLIWFVPETKGSKLPE